MFTTLALITAFFAILIGLKAASRISSLEKELSKLQKEVASLRVSTRRDSKLEASQPEPDTSESSLGAASSMRSDSGDSALSAPSNIEPEFEPSYLATQQHHSEQEQTELNQSQQTQVQLATFTQQEDPLIQKHAQKLIANFQENWLVWVGALAMLIGGGYLVQVIGSHIEFSPLMRVSFAFSLSLLMVLAGEWFHRKEQNNPDRAARAQGFTYVPAAVTGTGLTGIYCTVIFAFVVYQMLTPSVSLIILAAAAFCSLALSLRQGPLMAVLGLIGGYTAPLWIGGNEPNYFLLAGYICAISFAATLLMQKVHRAWIAPSIAVPHVIWMLLLIENIPTELLFSWLAIYLSITLYLIFAVPRMGWMLNPRFRHYQSKWTNQPTATSLAVALLTFSAITRMPELNTLQMAYCYTMLVAIIWLPALRTGWSLRVFLPSILVSATALIVLTIAFDALYMLEREASILFALAVSIALIGFRTYCQSLSDRSQISNVLLLVLAPTMGLVTLFYVEEFMHGYALYWTLFCTLIAAYYAFLSQRLRSLALECSAVVHALISGVAFVWLSDTWLTTAISIQVAVMALQIQAGLFRPASWAVKIVMGILVVRLTLLPFIPQWQPVESGHWAWVILSYVPSLAILAYARSVLAKQDSDLTNWFEGAFLHVFLMALFTQTNFWLTGQYGYLGHIDFTSAVVFANQALVMGLVYSYRSQFAQQLTLVYQAYSYLLWGIFALLTVWLNSVESPLITNNVSAQAMPVFNMLSLGWLLPACILIAAVVRRWNTLRVHRLAVACLGFALAAIWLGMSIRQFWQTTSMTLFQPTSMAELFSYSVAGLMVGGALTWRGVTHKAMMMQRIGLIILAFVALKVFLWDVSSLDGFWRAISFLGLGASLIALGWLFQKLHRSVTQTSEP
ncbi:DUF2339 domain-containing protein [Vibrio parahaemolyticus]|uniref:DUF2339 domain-containing protein n=1 Tax=Vibrio parahaemolyticus TaxID=670 RepID=UPI000871138C|nr:DUF2339 domain-containing protein [Vibrio parahaemolyticus]AOV91620.1 membrane protein [Vibrio parahaemolyticus]MBO0177077.1 DUF2339 domain-containing protein [Vibrio parahaemolyticus]MDF4288667.1 DUF2339 domain-containing protein [Vibrio parahaemolyticus]MDF4303062.1 DUF2339 domain-containing protein [Vibrio parahaemolyticus]MDF5288614.1 DUF2339 domain-containing protein [Vibrio parahaemolyticus]